MDYRGVVVRFLQGQQIFVFPKMPTTAVGAPRLLFSAYRGLCLREEADHSPPSSARLRMSGALSPLPLMLRGVHRDTLTHDPPTGLEHYCKTRQQRNANKPRFLNGIVGLLRPCTVTAVGTSRDERTRLTAAWEMPQKRAYMVGWTPNWRGQS
jgi:hypothetical protein